MADLDTIIQEIKTFLEDNQATIQQVAERATEVFEARSLIAIVHHYIDQDYDPKPRQQSDDGYFQFMYSPSAYPWNHSYFEVFDKKENRVICEIRHNQAVAGRWCPSGRTWDRVKDYTPRFQADIAIIKPGFLLGEEPTKGNPRLLACVPNNKLITIAEVKKLQPSPMLIASFQGILYSIIPPFVVDSWFDTDITSFLQKEKHPYPMLFTDGTLSSDNVKNVVRTMLEGQKARISIVENGMGFALRKIVDQLRFEQQ